MTELQNTLPAGWDSKIDGKTGKTYYINHHTRTTTWDDPRSRQHRHEHIPLQDLKPVRASPLLVRSTQESSLTNSTETDEAVSKISAMFPTVSDTHIRLLLKKYMKSIFPKAEETIILDVLTSNDNHIQKASDCLKRMGFERRDPVKLLQEQQRQAEEAAKEEEKHRKTEDTIVIPLTPPLKTAEERDAIQSRLQERYKDVSGQVITIALESVQFDELRADQILQIMLQEETAQKQETNSKEPTNDTTDVPEDKPTENAQTIIPISHSRQSFKTLLIAEKAEAANKTANFGRFAEENDDVAQRVTLAKGPNEKLLLVDYITWQGPNAGLRNGPQRSLAKGPNKANLSSVRCRAEGPNSELRKGPKAGLAKGGVFKQFRSMAIGESRGK